MNARKFIIPVLLVLFAAAGATATHAQEWRKLGQKDVDFHMDHDRIIARDKGGIREIHMSVTAAPRSLKTRAQDPSSPLASPAYQAYLLLRIGFVVAPLLFVFVTTKSSGNSTAPISTPAPR